MIADEWSRSDDGRERLFKAYWMMRDSDISNELRGYLDVWGQPYGGWTMGQLSALYCIWYLMTNEHVAYAQFDVGSPPLKDSERDGNQALLNGLSDNLEIEVHSTQRGGDQDGVVWCSEFDMFFIGSTRPIEIEGLRTVPLEIGYTDASSILLHLTGSGFGVARWPYGSRFVTVLSPVPVTKFQNWRSLDDRPSWEHQIQRDIAEFVNRVVIGRMFGQRAAGLAGLRGREFFVLPSE
ncbi:hypothetical protein [Actinophytocola glycyrrhizae]|uniref:Uncharacterized protein n=1 Tax=Actinophytocola glycyrrhizae TaxID=2044873 RepID=A0ABV9S0E4_9PSEU